ncbi:MAG: cellulase family glycosylhydrolase [Chloroflexota bacterium]|nr:cellulase family glycosylhydrolase [Chloroflexota bacterium]
MKPPVAGWLLAASASLALLVAVSALSTGPLETLSIDLRHRLAAAAARPSTQATGSVDGRMDSRVGVNVFLEQEVEPEKRQRSLELLRDAGVGWVRQELPWEQIEPVARGDSTDPNFGGSTWAKYDDIVARADALGLKLILRLDTSPRWALPADAADGLGPPLRSDDYWNFVSQVATRYRGNVAAYQVWNEPNLNTEWGRQPPDPPAYARLLRGASERIHAADPAAQVLMAALAPTRTENADALNELIYLQQLYDAGVRGTFDVLAVQAYGLRGGPDDPRVGALDVTFSRPLLVRQVMERNGDATTPIWATEMGWNVNPPDLAIQSYGRVTPSLQARYTLRAFERVREQWPWMQVECIWYWKRPDDTNPNQDWFWFRLADPDFRLQPVYYALRDASLTAWR